MVVFTFECQAIVYVMAVVGQYFTERTLLLHVAIKVSYCCIEVSVVAYPVIVQHGANMVGSILLFGDIVYVDALRQRTVVILPPHSGRKHIVLAGAITQSLQQTGLTIICILSTFIECLFLIHRVQVSVVIVRLLVKQAGARCESFFR